MNDFNYDNEIIEISSEDAKVTPQQMVIEETKVPPKTKKSLKDKWNGTSKGTKATIIIVCILLVVVVFVILYFSLFRDDEPEINVDDPIVIEKDNYRYEDGKLVFLNKSDKAIGEYQCSIKDNEECYVAKADYSSDKFDRITNIDESGKELEKNSQIYLDNFVFVYDNGVISLYNIESKEKELELNSIKTYNTEKNLVVIEDEDSKYGLIEITENGYEYLIRCSYDNLGIVNTQINYLIAQDKDAYYIVDSTGKKMSKNINAEVKSVNAEFIVATKNNVYNLYNYEYEELLSDYDYISLHDEVIALVKSNRLYLNDRDLNKLYEDGIRLENSNYVKKYVYDKNNKLIETKKSYEVSVEDNIAKITIGKDTREINILEGLISSKLSYLSYYDGKLYFYSDEEKEDVLGTYTCINKNRIDTIDSVLANCNIYTNETGVSGIYNNEYVFIYDNESNENINYYLYSLKEKKNKGTYSEINILNNDELGSTVQQNYTSASFIIAKSATGSNKGNYGVLEINSDKVEGRVAFKYESITKDNDYYLFINIDKTNSIYDKSFKKISNEFDYIKLFNKYYVGINNNKLNVYGYDKTTGILENDILVTNNNFEIDFTDGFVITINKDVYKYAKNGKLIIEDESVEPAKPENSSQTEDNGETNEE